MIFYHEARVDGLEKRVETSTEMTETFINREDFLYFRHVEFGKRAKKFGPAENSSHRPILVGNAFWSLLKFNLKFYKIEFSIGLINRTTKNKKSKSTDK